MYAKLLDGKTYWSLPIKDVFSSLKTAQTGLTTSEAERRLKEYGPNVLERRKPATRLEIFARQLKSPLIFVLLIAGTVTLSLGDQTDAIFIFLAAFVNAFLGYYQEYKAQQALEHLKSYMTERVRVTRDGQEREIDTRDLVIGDIIHVATGDRIPADGRVIHQNDLQVDQSILTGESLPVEKTTQEAGEKAPVADQHSMIFSGTVVVQGFGQAVVTATDQKTQLGKIATLVALPQEDNTPLQKSLMKLTLKSTVFIFALAALMFFIAQGQGVPTLDAFLIAVAILVAAVPEGLPVVMTVILAVGVQRLAKKNGVVRKLAAAETLGSTSVILTDKTGTLTQAKMSLSRIRLFTDVDAAFLVHVALLNIDVVVENPTEDSSQWRFIGKPLEIALAKAAAEHHIHFPSVKEGKEALHILPFNSLNKFAASLYKMPVSWYSGKFKKTEPYILSIVGAPEILLKFSDISESDKANILAQIKTMADEGDRLVAVAVKEIDSIEDFNLKDHKHLKDLRFLGTISFRDPLRPGVAKAMEEVMGFGIRVIMVTGDHAGTARAIAREIGIEAEMSEIIDGTELDEMTEVELDRRIKTLKIVSRVSPDGKVKILKALQKTGEIVAMNGDGINDAPALNQADIGVAMGTGTDVSKDVSDLVLLDDNFETIVAAIKEGKKILDNIRKAIVYLGSTLFNEIFLIGGSLIMGLAVPINPLQILWVNFITDSFPGISLAFDERLDSLGNGAARINKKGIFTNEMRFLLGVNGTVSSLLLFFMYGWLLKSGYDEALVRTFIFGAFSSYSLFLIFAIRSLKSSIFSFNPFSNKYLLWSVLVGFAMTLIGIYVPFFQKLFNTVSLPGDWLIGIVLFGILNVVLIEMAKLLFQKSE